MSFCKHFIAAVLEPKSTRSMIRDGALIACASAAASADPWMMAGGLTGVFCFKVRAGWQATANQFRPQPAQGPRLTIEALPPVVRPSRG